MEKILVTAPEYDKAAAFFETLEDFQCVRVPEQETELAAAIRREQARYVIIGVVKYTGPLYDALTAGGVIARFGVGHDGVDKKQAARRGIRCTNTPGVLDSSVAECAAGMLLLAARHFADTVADNRRGVWAPRIGTELAGKTLAIVGCGHIGSRLAAIAKNGFGMTICGFDITAPRDESCYDRFSMDFAEAVRGAQFLSLHIPDLPATRDFLNAEKLAALAPGAWVINTARGTVVDEDALYDAAASGRIGGAVLDVFRQEPYRPAPSGKDLRTLPNVLMTPHIGSSTAEACRRMAEAAVANIRHARDGRDDAMTIVS